MRILYIFAVGRVEMLKSPTSQFGQLIRLRHGNGLPDNVAGRSLVINTRTESACGQSNTEFGEITRRLYAAISAPEKQRDWESIRDLYHPSAQLVRTGLDDAGQPFVLAMTFDEYVANATELLDGVEFCEREVHQDLTVFGNVARLASVYEYEFRKGEDVRGGRGVNFFNLVNDGAGWKIMNIVWDNERDGVTLSDAGLDD